jgi:cell division protein FtsL
MKDSIELKRKNLELSRVQLARQEQEFKIEERMEEIARLESMIEIQKNKEEELKVEISTLSKRE